MRSVRALRAGARRRHRIIGHAWQRGTRRQIADSIWLGLLIARRR
jgi:hypothetical protein